MRKQECSRNREPMSGTFRVGAFSPVVHIGNPKRNAEEIADILSKSSRLKGCDIVVTPELSITGYTCQDMFLNSNILAEAKKSLLDLSRKLPTETMLLVVGAPMVIEGKIYNCAVYLHRQRGIIGAVPKTYLANYGEFYEDRWFTPGDNNIILDYCNMIRIGCEVCEDLWAPIPPSTELALAGAQILLNCSASNELVGKRDFRRDLVRMQSAKTLSAYVYCSAGMTESVSDLVYGGHNIIAENGRILAESDLFDIESRGIVVADIDLDILNHERLHNKTFSRYQGTAKDMKITHIDRILGALDEKSSVHRTVDILPFVPKDPSDRRRRCLEIFDMQASALASRWMSTGSNHLVIGVSGGLDSTLALLVACRAADIAGMNRKDVVGITMPCFGTTSRTKTNAIKLMEILGCDSHEIDISKSVTQHLKDLGIPENDRSVAFENAQARERTQVLMDFANFIGGFVVGTGDLSELALGWCTYNGDHASMYNVNGSIPKTLVRSMVEFVGGRLSNDFELQNILDDILDTPVSPELLPPDASGNIQQLTEDSVGPYVLNDFFLYYHVRYGMSPSKIEALAKVACEQSKEYKFSDEDIEKWLKKFYARFARAQFKRNFCPDGVKVGSVSLSPRGDWRCPSEIDLSQFSEVVGTKKLW